MENKNPRLYDLLRQVSSPNNKSIKEIAMEQETKDFMAQIVKTQKQARALMIDSGVQCSSALYAFLQQAQLSLDLAAAHVTEFDVELHHKGTNEHGND